MRIQGEFFWMQNAAQQKTNGRANPLLKEIQNAIAHRMPEKAPKAVSDAMRAKIEDTMIDPKDKALCQVMEELQHLEEAMYGALGQVKATLSGLVHQQDQYTSIANGTADYDNVFHQITIPPEDQKRFEFTDWATYRKDSGYQAKDPLDLTIVQGSDGISMVDRADQAPIYAQWQADKEAYQVEKLKEYAAEQMPKIQDQIRFIPTRIHSIIASYSVKKMELLKKLPQGFELENTSLHLEDIKEMRKQLDLPENCDGKKLLAMLNQLLERQKGVVSSLGGKVNDVFDGIIQGNVKIPPGIKLDTYV